MKYNEEMRELIIENLLFYEQIKKTSISKILAVSADYLKLFLKLIHDSERLLICAVIL